MRIYIFIVVCCFVNGYKAQEVTQIPSELPMSTSEQLISNDGNGFCTYNVKMQKLVQIPVKYNDIETFYGRCRGYYFKKCINERHVTKTRIENQLREYNETVHKCCDGFAQNPDKNKCLPICEHNCVFGNCTSPNICSCYEGYESTADKPNLCKPKCVGCSNGNCLVPNVCLCNAGFNWDSEKKECIPFCDGNCHNGKCISPNKCECNEGFVHHATHSVCIPDCKDGCQNGQCVASNTSNKCECDYGYKFVNGSNNICEPICEMSCKNAKCIEPNVCECHNGYTVLDDNQPYICQCGLYCAEIDGMCHCLNDEHRVDGETIRNNISAICTEDTCINGACLTPFDCECYDGFEKDDSQICIAVNETCIDDPSNCNEGDSKVCNCINGVCSLNNQCVCVNGFQMSEDHENVCEPFCAKKCVNSFCINPNECECDIGYRLGYNESEKHICHPICDSEAEDNNGCINGTCIAPATCECRVGFMLSTMTNFTCIPDPFYKEAQTAGSNWSVVSIVIIVVLATLLTIAYFVNKRRLNNYNLPKRDDEANEPITGYVSEEL